MFFCWKYSIVKQKGGDVNVLVALDAIKIHWHRRKINEKYSQICSVSFGSNNDDGYEYG